MKLNHLGFACKNISNSIEYIKSFYQVEEISDCIYDEKQQATLCYITLRDSVAIELVSGKTVSGYLKNGISLYHVCYECSDIYQTIEILKRNGATVVCGPVSAKLFDGRLISFLNTELGLIELLEVKREIEINKQDEIKQEGNTNIVLVSNFTITPLQKYLLYYNEMLKTNYNIIEAPYNQIFQQILKPDSLINRNTSGYNIILISIEEWLHYAEDREIDYQERFTNITKDFIEALKCNSSYSNTSSIIIFTPVTKFNTNIQRQKFFEEAEYNMQISLEEAHIIYISSKELLKKIGNTQYSSPYSNEIAHIPYVERVYAAIANILMRKLLSIEGYSYKVIVIDCDNTLWEGNCGDTTEGGVKITVGKKYLQRFLLNQMEKGMLLCICSKNNEKDVMDVFKTNPDMILKKEHITAFKVNWRNKSDNILDLANKLNLSLDSFIFIDDSSYECEEVSQAFPEVLTIRIPDSNQDINEFLENLWVFDRYNVVKNSRVRTKYYKENFLREEERQKAVTFENFIKNLCITITISPLKEEEIERACELTKRTNQFNLSTRRRSESELRELLNKGYRCDVVYVNDRFGSYGMVGVMIYKSDDMQLKVENFLLSCRVLGRGIENKMVMYLGKTAQKLNKDTIIFEYKDNQKNYQVYRFICEIKMDIKITKQEYQEITVHTEKACLYQFVYKNHDMELIRKKDNSTVSNIFHRGKVLLEIGSIDNLIAAVLELDINSSIEEDDFTKDSIDEVISNLYKEVLQHDIDEEEGFIELGGDSIRAVKIVSDIFSKYNVELSLQDVFDYDLRRIISCVSCKLGLKDEKNVYERFHDSTFKDIVKQIYTKQNSKFSLSYCQEALMRHELMDTKTFVYNMPWIFQIKGMLDIEALQYAFCNVIQKHDVFRTVFKEKEGFLYQEVKDNMEFEIEQFCFTKKEDINQIIRQEEIRRFNISKGPLLRVVLIQTNDNTYLMIITIHHIIFDGWSYSLLFKDLSAFYQAYKIQDNQLIRQKSTLFTYADYVMWEREYSKTERMQQQIEYWKKQLKDLKLHELPKDTICSNQQVYEGLYVPIELNQQDINRLRNICINHSTTLYTGMLCVFDLLLYSLIQLPDVAVGTVVAMRNAKELEEIIGLFINTIVMRSKIKEQDSFIQLLQSNRKVVMEGFANKDAYFGEVIYNAASSIPENKDNPFYHAMLLFQNTPKNSFSVEGLQIRKYKEGYNIARGDLILELEEKEDILIGGFYYNTGYFSRKTIHGYVAVLKEIIINCTENPNKSINEIIANLKLVKGKGEN
ncbi:HAD-IIIC family phosphatase [Vallitalea sp.]|jgi:FkbH-like protein|uniref:HAD-IIIC family phosphatase n=1 Tax=Vallitalea sp. TaxID=1882829 RepID=UPI0025E0AE49|nr:HAD-IIIC family phosphatase [Vallitalea sp.]MCT4686737.1 HAD-IIIC family phosphatase [Vallitalea sp.]